MNAFVQRNPSIHELNQISRMNADSGAGLLATLRRTIGDWQQRRAAAEADYQFWNAALADPRLMAEITRAKEQHQSDAGKTRGPRRI